jgi:hypothetical protein
MQGRVKDGRASLPITFRLFNQPDFQIEFVGNNCGINFSMVKVVVDLVKPLQKLM